MERLTGRDEKGNLTVEGKEIYAGYLYNAASYLEEYEDTGLTPEQIMELKERDTAKAPRSESIVSYIYRKMKEGSNGY